MIAPHDDDGVLGDARFVEGGEQAADLRVHEARAGEIAADQITPLVVCFDPIEARLGQVPMQIPRKTRRVLPIVFQHLRQHAVVIGI